jgi:OOP family OmpA-OmpF porin
LPYLILAGSFILAGCEMYGGVTGAYDVQAVRRATPQGGTPFTAALLDEYRAAAIDEGENEHEWDDAAIFARKGLAAARGTVVAPEELSNWKIPGPRTGELADARARLVAALDGGARDRVPGPAAHAQVSFDCWVEEEAEADTNNSCRAEFLKTLPLLQPVAAAPAAPAPAPAPAAKTYQIYFAFDKSTLTPEGRQTVDGLIADLKANPSATIHIVGKADRSGSDAYNQKLSERRAKVVTDALAAGGIAANRITPSAVGEAQPPVPTADGVKEPRNRVVEVSMP